MRKLQIMRISRFTEGLVRGPARPSPAPDLRALGPPRPPRHLSPLLSESGAPCDRHGPPDLVPLPLSLSRCVSVRGRAGSGASLAWEC